MELARLTPSRLVLPLLRILVLVLGILALARPQWGVEATKIYRQGIAIAMVVDVSSGMAALDMVADDRQSSRLDVVKVKATFREFVVRAEVTPALRQDARRSRPRDAGPQRSW